MTGEALYQFLYGWVSGIVGSSVPVVRAYQNVAKPANYYLAIEDDQSWTPFGREDVVQGATSSIVHHDYTVKPVIWEINRSDSAGYGDALRALRESLGTRTTKDLFFTAEIGILSVGQILTMPWTSTETEVVRQKRMELRLSVGSDIADTVQAIATAELVNQIGE